MAARGSENRAGCGPKIHWLRHCSISHWGASDGGRSTDGMHSRRVKIAGKVRIFPSAYVCFGVSGSKIALIKENGCGVELDGKGPTRLSIRVAMDARYIREKPSGIGTYTQALVDRLPRAGASDQFIFWRHRLARAPFPPVPTPCALPFAPPPLPPSPSFGPPPLPLSRASHF